MEERLQKILAQAGITSRRGAEKLILQGRVTIDGKVVTEMGIRLDPAHHRITCNGKPVGGRSSKITLLLHKPRGYVTTMHDPQGRPIVISLLKGVKTRVYPVGRLDFDSEGALLLTNDGDLANRILHPSHEINKTYEARVSGHPAAGNLAQLEKGIMLEGRRTWPAELTVLSRIAGDTVIRVIIHEGRKRQIRKMFAAIGHRVIRLKRTAYGSLNLADLPVGTYRLLDETDLQLIFASKKKSLQ